MKTSVKSTITGTITGIQDLLTELSTFLPDCDIFQTVVAKEGLAALQLEVIADNTTISEILEVVDACEVRTIESIVTPFYFNFHELNNNTQADAKSHS